MSTMELEGRRTDAPARVKRCLWSPRRWAISLASLLVASCGHFDIEHGADDTPQDAPAADAPAADGLASDAPAVPRCDPAKRFGDEIPVTGFGDFELQRWLTLVPDELTGYVTLARQPASESPDFDIYKVTRASDTAVFNTPTKLGISTTEYESGPAISSDGKLLIFVSDAGGDGDLYVSEAGSDGSFSVAERANEVSLTGRHEGYPSLGPDGTLYFTRWIDDAKRNDLYASVRSAGSFGPAIEVPGVNSDEFENGAEISGSGLQIIFSRSEQLYIGERDSTSEPFSVDELRETSGKQIEGTPSWMSADACRLYYTRSTYENGSAATSSRVYTRARPQ